MITTKPSAAADPLKPLRQKVQVLRRQVPTLAEDEVWRDFLAVRADGQTSTRAMNERQLEAVVRALHAAGAPKAGRGSRFAGAPQHAKCRAIWITLFEAGVVANRSDTALDVFIRRQSGQDIGTLNAAAWGVVIEALKGWAARKGVELRP